MYIPTWAPNQTIKMQPAKSAIFENHFYIKIDLDQSNFDSRLTDTGAEKIYLRSSKVKDISNASMENRTIIVQCKNTDWMSKYTPHACLSNAASPYPE